MGRQSLGVLLGTCAVKFVQGTCTWTACLELVIGDISGPGAGYVPSHLKMYLLFFFFVFLDACALPSSKHIRSSLKRRLGKFKNNLHADTLH